MNRVIGAIAIIFLFSMPGFCQEIFQNSGPNQPMPANKVTVNTEKRKYEQSEVIRVALKNGFKYSVFSHAGGSASLHSIKQIERKKPDGGWEILFALCQYPNCTFDLDAPLEIKPGVMAVFGWKPNEYPDGKDVYVPLKPGTYRLLINYRLNQGKTKESWSWATAYSNEFIITPLQTGKNRVTQ